MSQPRTRIISVGEVMIEMARGSDGRFSQGCGGDTFNTAVYLARQSHEVAYATALGDDRYSDAIAALAAAEGVATDLILRIPNRLPGLYMIETDSAGERSFHYWRESSPARELFEFPEWNRIAESLLDARLIYFSGITLSIYSNAALGRFLAILEMARQNGAKVAFDGNYRPRGWTGDIQRTRTVFMEALKRVDIALPTFDDEALLWGDASPEATICSMSSGTVGTPISEICAFIRWVAIAVIPGRPPRPCGMCVAVLPSMVNFRSAMRDFVMMSNPQNVKNRWVSTPSPRAALARIRPG